MRMIKYKGKIGYIWPHVNPRRMKMHSNEVYCTLMIPLEDDDDEKMKIGERITMVLFHEP